jgi:hypothetical protein
MAYWNVLNKGKIKYKGLISFERTVTLAGIARVLTSQ